MKNKSLQPFEEKKFWQKIADNFKAAGMKTIYVALLLFFAFRRKETPKWAKGIVVGALGYFLSPIDGIPDLTPFIGYTDDIGVMMLALGTISVYVNEEVKENAKNQLLRWFPQPDEEAIADIEKDL